MELSISPVRSVETCHSTEKNAVIVKTLSVQPVRAADASYGAYVPFEQILSTAAGDKRSNVQSTRDRRTVVTEKLRTDCGSKIGLFGLLRRRDTAISFLRRFNVTYFRCHLVVI